MANREKRVSVRFAAVGGEAVKAEMRDIGTAGNTAMDRIAASAAPAEAGLDNMSNAAVKARQMLEQVAMKASATAAAMRTTVQATSAMQAQINRATGVTSPTGMSAAEMLQQGQALDNLRAKFNPIFGVVRQYRNEVSEMRAAHMAGAISADELAAAISRSRQAALGSIAAYKNQSHAIAQMSRAARGGTLRMQQMFFQVNDIGVSLAGGMNPFIVLAQQGTQIAQIYGFGNGGVGAAFRDVGGLIGGLVTKFWPVLAVVGAVTSAIGGMTGAINETSAVTVTFGDTALAVWQVISEGIWDWIKPAVDMIAPWFQAAWDLVVSGVKWVGNAIINGISFAVEGIRIAVDAIPAMFSKAFLSAKSHVLVALGEMVHGVYDMIKSITDGLNSAFGTSFSSPVGLMAAGTAIMKEGNDAGDAASALAGRADILGRLGAAGSDIFARDPMGDFFNAVSGRAQANARNRLAEDDKKGGKGGAGKAAKEQKDAVDDLIKSLTQELAVLRETDPIKKKMLEYSEQLADATAVEREQVLGLVTTLDNAKNGWEAIKRSLSEYVEESKRIGDDIGSALVGAFNAGSDAVAKFVKTGKLSFTDMVTSMIVDMARLGAQKYIMGPLANMLTGFMDPLAGALGKIGLPAIPSFAGGGWTGSGPRSGGLDGMGGKLAMIHPQEKIVDMHGRRGGRGGMDGPTVININGVRDAASFRQSRTQIAADLSRAVSMGRRNV